MIISEVSSNNNRQPIINLLEIAQRRKAMLLIPVLAGVGIGVGGYLTAPVSYMSEAVLVLDMRRLQALPSESAITPLPQDSPVLRSELDIISSRMMARKVIERLQSENIVVPTHIQSRSVLSKWLSPEREVQTQSEANPVIRERQQIDLLLSRLRVSNDGRSYTIFLSYRAPDPAYAAEVANAFGAAYLDHQIDVQQGATRRLSDWLGEKLVTLRNDLESDERVAEEFRQKSRLAVDQGQITFQAQRVAALNSAIISATDAVSSAQARLQTANSLLEINETPALTEVLASPAIQNLRNEEARVERQLKELKANGALKSAEIPVLIAEQDALKQQIADQVKDVIKSLNNEINIALERRAGLENALKKAEADLANANQAQVTATQLEREANASRTVYESYLTRYKQLIEQDGIAAPEAQMISSAEPATAKSSPHLRNWLLFGLGLGGVIAFTGTLLKETFDKVRPAQTVSYQLAGMPTATMLPAAPQLTIPTLANQGFDPSSAFGRAVKSIHDRVRLVARGRDSLALAILSPEKGDGKTLLATALAQQFASAGTSVVIIDATGNGPGLSEAFGLPFGDPDPIFSGRTLQNGTLLHDHVSGIDIAIPKRQTTRGDWLTNLVRELRNDHKIILVDLPAAFEDKDAVLLSHAVDTTILVTRMGRFDPDRTSVLIQTLASIGRKPVVAVMNQMTPSYHRWLMSAAVIGQRRFNELARWLPIRRFLHTKPNAMHEQV